MLQHMAVFKVRKVVRHMPGAVASQHISLVLPMAAQFLLLFPHLMELHMTVATLPLSTLRLMAVLSPLRFLPETTYTIPRC